MTDLTTDHLQQLLDQATPGTWDYIPSQEDAHTHDTQTSTMCINMGDNSEHPKGTNADLELATAAPQLAEEVIRQRGEIKGLITAMEVKAATGESQSPATIAGYLKEIVLGETND